MTIILFVIGLLVAYQEINNTAVTIATRVSEAAGQLLLFIMLTALSYALGKSVDAIQMKKAYYVRKYFLSGSAAVILWFTLDSARQVLAAAPYADLGWLGARAVISIAAGYVAYKVSGVLDLRKKITRLLIGLPVYSNDGKWLGVVEAIGKHDIEYRNRQSSKTEKLSKGKFMLSEGRIVLA